MDSIDPEILERLNDTEILHDANQEQSDISKDYDGFIKIIQIQRSISLVLKSDDTITILQPFPHF